jgi:hypothetical protein
VERHLNTIFSYLFLKPEILYVILLFCSLSPIHSFLLFWFLSIFSFGGLKISPYMLLYENTLHIPSGKHKVRYGRVKLSLSLINYTPVYEEVQEERRYRSVTPDLPLDGGEWSVSCPGLFNSGETAPVTTG